MVRVRRAAKKKGGGCEKKGGVPHPPFFKKGGARSTGTPPVYATDSGQLESEDSAKKTKISQCPTCWNEIGKGIRHDCKQSQAADNVVSALKGLPDAVQDQVASSLLREKAKHTQESSKMWSSPLLLKEDQLG